MKLWRKISTALELLELVDELREDWIAGGRLELLQITVPDTAARRCVEGVDRAVELVRRFKAK